MNILMMTNTYKPLLGGLERSVESFAKAFRKKGHRVVIVTPEMEGMKPEKDVVRIPAVQHFNGSDFAVQLPVPGMLADMLNDFHPDIVHSHHPFLIGDTALRIASKCNVPLVFTHHTLYEENVHYVPGNEEALKRFVIELSTGYANLADQVFAPSESVMRLMQERGVQTPIEVVPTGVYVKKFARGAGQTFRKMLGIPDDAFVVGYIGRLAPEKNLGFLAGAVAQFLRKEPKAYFLIGGDGPSREDITQLLDRAGVGQRVRFAGVLKGRNLIDAYHAMDTFVFASQSETQGLVIAEAMACGVAVVAVDAPGVREVVTDALNGRLLDHEDLDDFVSALEWTKGRSVKKVKAMKKACKEKAAYFSVENSTEKALRAYTSLSMQGFFFRRPVSEDNFWMKTTRLIQAQWGLVKNFTKAAGAMIGPGKESG